MADFEIAVSKTIENEGGDKYTETPGDMGGSTKYGISLRFLISCFKHTLIIPKTEIGETLIKIIGKEPNEDTIKNLSLEDAKFLYKYYFWDANRYGEIEDQDIANKVFDLSVLFGQFIVNKNIQKAINIVNEFETYNSHNILNEDGIIGLHTISFLNNHSHDNLRNKIRIVVLKQFMQEHCVNICNKDKTQDDNLKGWLNRVMS